MIGLPLAQRLEPTEASANVELVEARASQFPDSGACWIPVAGAKAMFDGPQSPCTQSFGLGLFAMPTPEDMRTLEDFFHSRGAPAIHEVSTLAAKALLPILTGRGYRPIELSDVMFLPLKDRPGPTPETAVRVRLAETHEQDLWCATGAAGWSEQTELADLIPGLMRIMAARPGALLFLAEKDGIPIATGGLFQKGGVALLAGASTVPEYRRQGAQRALFRSRLEYAANIGCDTAMICTEPGSDSQRNAAHCGFRIAYTRIKWALDPPAAK